MIQEETELEVADNTGAKKVKCFRVLGGTGRKYARVGDVVICSVKAASPEAKEAKKGTVTKALIVRTKSPIRRKDGSHLKFHDNSCVLLDDKLNLRGTRVFGPIPREVRENGHLKVASLAPEVI